jgi:hypothetical protein
MPKLIMEEAAHEHGFCCIFAMIIKAKTRKGVFKFADVSLGAIKYWRTRVLNGTCKCENKHNCMNVKKPDLFGRPKLLPAGSCQTPPPEKQQT